MIEWIITSSILILIIVALRYFLKGKISLRLQYGLWALVLIRLLIPFSVGSSSISILNFTDRIAENRIEVPYQEDVLPDNIDDVQPGDVPGTTQVVTPNTPDEGRDVISSDTVTPDIVTPDVSVGDKDVVSPDKITPDTPGQDKDEPVVVTPQPVLPGTTVPDSEVGSSSTITDIGSVDKPGDVADEPVTGEPADNTAILIGDILRKVALYIWLAGIVLVGGYLVLVNVRFTYGLKKKAEHLPEITGYPLAVYFSKNIDTPCMHGLIRPRIYVTEEAMANEKVLRHVLEHETTHYRHGDHVWGILRGVCLALHWYNPFVWLAAFLSRNDAELACDESTINRIGEAEREEYGRTLIGLTCQKKNGLFVTATTMTGSKKSIKERIVLIAKKPQMAVYTLVAVLLIATVAIGCTFTGARDNEDTTIESGDNKEDETTNEDETTTGEEEPTTTGKEDVITEISPVVKGGIAANINYIFGVDSEGKLLINTADTDGHVDKTVLSQWEDLVSVEAGGDLFYEYGVVGLKNDGTVYTWNYNLNGWTNIVQISVSDTEVIGLKKDGTVLSKGSVYMGKANWKDIVQVSAGNGFVVGLKADGTVVAVGDNTYGQCEVSNWTDIEMIAAGDGHTVGLRSDGTVLVAGLNLFGENDVTAWKNIVFVAAGDFVTLGITSNGRVFSTGRNIEYYKNDLRLWSNMAYITSGDSVIAGVTKDGQMVMSSVYDFPATDFSNVSVPETSVAIDNKKELPVVEQKYANPEIIGKDLPEPINGIIQTEAELGLVIPMEIADRIYYDNGGDGAGAAIYVKSDMGVRAEDGVVICEYSRTGHFYKVSIDDAIQILSLPVQPTWLVGSEEVQKYVNECFSDVMEQLCIIEGVENVYEDSKLVDVDGSCAITNSAGEFLSERYFEYRENLTIEDGYVYLYSSSTDWQLIRNENAEEFGEVGRLITDNITKIMPVLVTADKFNQSAILETIVEDMYNNEAFPYSAEKSYGKGLQSEVISMKGRTGNRKSSDGPIDSLLFGNNFWYEVTDAENRTLLDNALDFGFVRLYNDNKEEFIVLKTINGAIYKTADSVRYFTYVGKDGKAVIDYPNLSYGFDYFVFSTKLKDYMVIDDDPNKTRDELAYDMMETYRACGASLHPENIYYFDELKIIELESYDESDSAPETLIGIITEDVLKFHVKYAMNTDRIPLAGARDEGKGEYEGYTTDIFTVSAERRDGKWYCTGRGNG